MLTSRVILTSMGVGMTINKMTFPRQPESLITEYVMAHHPRFKDTPIWRDRNHTTRIEGGDELVLKNKHTVAIGVSERTSSKTIQALAKELFANPLSTFDTVLAVEIPHNHAMMHLDTVFIMINHDQLQSSQESLMVLEISMHSSYVRVKMEMWKLNI